MGTNRVINDYKCVGITIHGLITIKIYYKPRTSKHKVVVQIGQHKVEHDFKNYEEANTYFIKISKEIKSGKLEVIINEKSNSKSA